MKFKIGDTVRLTTFNNTLNSNEDVELHVDYWKLIGTSGKTVEYSFSKSRYLIQFGLDVSSLGLECHNKINNSLWILETDLEKL